MKAMRVLSISATMAMAMAVGAGAGNLQFAALGGAVVATNDAAVAEWRGNAGNELFPLHPSTNGWEAAAEATRSVRFMEATSPLAMQDAATSLVSRVFIVATATNLAECSSLLFASTSLWLAPDAGGGMTLAPELPARATVAVDGLPGGQVAANARFLAGVALASPVAACDVFVGGHAATPVWRRGWQGAIHEVVMLGADIAPAESYAVRALLANYWRTPNAPPSQPDAAATLRAIGLNHHGFYATTFVTH